MSVCHVPCLEALRIVSRDRSHLDVITGREVLRTMQWHANLYVDLQDEVSQIRKEYVDRVNNNSTVVIEAQKCLCNLIFNSSSAQRSCSYSGCIEGIVQRLKTYRDPGLPHEIKYFDMRMLFLLTALVADIRPRLRQELHGLTYLMEALDLIIKTSKNHESRDNRVEDTDVPLTGNEVDLACEILKVLFNLTVHVDKTNLDEEEEAHFMRMVSILHDLLICQTESKEKREELVR
ncbi:PREDICTED: synembryn-A-like [Priapulus caudatus]|uniref:Synembryn-A-like n=1 Tax=Priapulus caudatus TaxID=37621 RepID=A0ABM1EG65_PRICU|nr:PREDICTED: synembryn-A-like [Priapulus caudatus]